MVIAEPSVEQRRCPEDDRTMRHRRIVDGVEMLTRLTQLTTMYEHRGAKRSLERDVDGQPGRLERADRDGHGVQCCVPVPTKPLVLRHGDEVVAAAGHVAMRVCPANRVETPC